MVVSGPRYHFNSPIALASDGSHVWVANSGSDTVTAANASNGSWVRTAAGSSLGLSNPRALVIARQRVWVANNNSDSLTELPPG
jgi:6-phosphogluconolactonase (cycloisomerase 2 family)